MDMSPEQIDQLFTIEEPDVKLCLHDLRVHPLSVEVDGATEHGFIGRMVGHSAENQPVIIDFVATESVLQAAVGRIVDAGMSAAIERMMKNGDPTKLIEFLLTEGDQSDERDHERSGDPSERR